LVNRLPLIIDRITFDYRHGRAEVTRDSNSFWAGGCGKEIPGQNKKK